jgi:flavin reductase (NADH)
MFVRIDDISVNSDGDGLIYFARQFHRLVRPVAAAASASTQCAR